MTNAIDERRRALEESFFAKQNNDVIENLRKRQEQAKAKEVLAQIAGIQDAELLDELVDAGVGATTLAALVLYPLVAVAWADGKMDEKEKHAVLRAAHERGIEEGSDSHQLLEGWLKAEPKSDLFAVWKDYVESLKSTLPEAQFATLENFVIEHCRDVANAAGGILGIGALSSEEAEKIKELQAVFA